MDKIISVVIPTFNRQELTDRAVRSVFTCNPDLFEVLIVDDCGTVPYSFDSNHNGFGVEVRVLRSPTNQGPGLARKAGVSQSRGSVICFLDSDDVFEHGWLDAVLKETLRSESAFRDGLFVAGMTRGASAVQAGYAQILAHLPRPIQPMAIKLTTIAFNPFYTPATAISKQLCQFWEAGSHCEDYFTNAMAIFRARRVFALPIAACTISRSPGTPGGLSSTRREMARGEFQVRKAMLSSNSIPLGYRALIPFGMAYSIVRRTLKAILSLANK